MANIDFPTTGGTKTVSWSVGACAGNKKVSFTIPSSARTWLSINPETGVTSGDSTVTAINNDSGGRRDTYIDVTLNDAASPCTTKRITVSQIACPGDCTSFSIPASAGTFTLPSGVTTVGTVITPFTVVEGCDSANISFETTAGNVELKTGTTNNVKNIQVKTRIPENSSHSVLNSTVKVKYGTYECCTLNFKQNGTIPCDCNVVKYYFDSNKRTFPLSGSGGAYIEIASGTTGGCGRMSALTNASISNVISDIQTLYPTQDTFVFKAKLESSDHTVTAAYDIKFIDSDGHELYNCNGADWVMLTPTPCYCNGFSRYLRVDFGRRRSGGKEIYYYLTTDNPKKMRVIYDNSSPIALSYYYEEGFDSTNTGIKVAVIPYGGGEFTLSKYNWDTKDCECVSLHHTTANWVKIINNGNGDFYLKIEANSTVTPRECYVYFNYLIDCGSDYEYDVVGMDAEDNKEIVTNLLPSGIVCRTVRIKVEQLGYDYCNCTYANAYIDDEAEYQECDIISIHDFRGTRTVSPTVGTNVWLIVEDYDEYGDGYIASYYSDYSRDCGVAALSGDCIYVYEENGSYFRVYPNNTSNVQMCEVSTTLATYTWNESSQQWVYQTCCQGADSGYLMILTDWRTCAKFNANMTALFNLYGMTLQGLYRDDNSWMHDLQLNDPWLSDKFKVVTCTINGAPATYTWMRAENSGSHYKVTIDINYSTSTKIGYYKFQITIGNTTCATEPIRVVSEPVSPPHVECDCNNVNFNHNFIVADGTVFNSNAGDVTFGTASVNEECYDLIAYSDNTFITPRIENGTIIVNIGANTTGTYVSCRLDIIVFRNGEEISCDGHFATIGFGVNP